MIAVRIVGIYLSEGERRGDSVDVAEPVTLASLVVIEKRDSKAHR